MAMDLMQHRANAAEAVVDAAERLSRSGIGWADFWAAVFGPSGIIFGAFPEPEDRRWFKSTPQAGRVAAIEERLLRGGEPARSDALRVITVRMSAELHQLLVDEARDQKLSMNKLCLAKLSRPEWART